LPDIFSKKKRSQIMSLISGKETKPEIMVRKYLFGQGFRYRKNVASLPGKPDIVLLKYKTVVFVHGCFWHGHKNCNKARLPASNAKFWEAKIQRNIERDAMQIKELRKAHWKVITIWECDLKTKKIFESTMKRFMKKIA
jgi:DNA mismatch endonuclease (patch repair protein)